MTIAPTENFEARMLELERIVSTLEEGNIPLADALDAYQKGTLLVRECQAALTSAEQKIQGYEHETSLQSQAGSNEEPAEGDRK
jgi:exodeoxyribonuclease VII small subunit